MTALGVCMLTDTEYLTQFGEYIYDLDFNEKPNYNYLKFLLTKNLLDKNKYPNNNYDWIEKLNNGNF